MATFILSSIGASLGAGFGKAGAALGMLVGSGVGGLLDSKIFSPKHKVNVSNKQISSIPIQNSAYGIAINKLYGEARLSGNVIWADSIKEHAHHHSSNVRGGKMGGKTKVTSTSYTYSVSLAVAICEGPIDAILNVWADSKLLTGGNYNIRIYNGSEDQIPDSLIEAKMGHSRTPAYRGIAYVVIEDFPLNDYGNRIPNFSFQVRRQPKVQGETVEGLVSAICIIPGSGEFVYDTTKQYLTNGKTYNNRLIQAGKNTVINQNNYQQKTDAKLSLDQLMNTCKNLKWAAPVVGWFGDSLDAAKCSIKPGVENRDRQTYPDIWKVGNYDRGNAKQITLKDHRPIYGGTVNDASLLNYLDELKNRQLKIMLNPMLFIDRLDKPWRGHLTCSEFDIYNFFNKKQGYNNFIIHYAKLVKGKVDAFVIGSELKRLTSVRNSNNQFPAVIELVNLAKKVKQILGPEVTVTYAADWSEYHHTDGGWYHLDELWASPFIDVIGIDAYFPLSNNENPVSEEQIISNWHKEEGYHYCYSDRQKTKKESLTAPYAWKNIEWWWRNPHINPDGKRTAWQPKSKKIWFTEYGFPSVDLATNEPNVFYDPEAYDGGLPLKSGGKIDFAAQRTAIKATEIAWQNSEFVERKFLWCWDARPYPYWPKFDNLWADSYKWSRGHWVNGKFGLTELSALILELCLEAGIAKENIVIEGLDEPVDGYVINNSKTSMEALSELQTAYFFNIVEVGHTLKFSRDGTKQAFIPIDSGEIIYEDQLLSIERDNSKLPISCLKLVYFNKDDDFQTAVYDKLNPYNTAGGSELIIKLDLVCQEANAARIAAFNLMRKNNLRNIYNFRVSIKYMFLEPGDLVILKEKSRFYKLRIKTIFINKDFTLSITAVDYFRYESNIAEYMGHKLTAKPIIEPDYNHQILDIPAGLNSHMRENNLRVALWSNNESFKPVSLYVSDDDEYKFVQNINFEAHIGYLMKAIPKSQPGFLDKQNKIIVSMVNGELESIDYWQLLSGKNMAYINGEIVQFMKARLVRSHIYELSDILRGQNFTEHNISEHEVGCRFVLLNDNLSTIYLPNNVREQEIHYKLAADNQILNDMAEYAHYHKANSIKEPSPVNVSVDKLENNLCCVSWFNRSLNDDYWQENYLRHNRTKPVLVEIFCEGREVQNEVVYENKYFFELLQNEKYTVSLSSVATDGSRGDATIINI